MAKLFNIYVEDESGDSTYLGSFKAKAFNEAVREALEENGYDTSRYDKKTKTYEGRQVWEEK